MSMKRRIITAGVITITELFCLWYYLNVNWVIGGILMLLATPLAVLAITSGPTKFMLPKQQIISQASLALALKEAIEFAKVDMSTGDITVTVTQITKALENHRVGQE